MIDPPSQWKELFIILQIAHKPVLSAFHWHEQHRFSSTTPPLMYTDLADYLSLLQPLVDRKTNDLQMLPTFFHLRLKNRISLMCFLKEIYTSIPQAEQIYLVSHLQSALDQHTCSTSNHYFKLLLPCTIRELSLTDKMFYKLDFLKNFISNILYERLDSSTKRKMQFKEAEIKKDIISEHQVITDNGLTINNNQKSPKKATKRLLKADNHEEVDIKKVKLLAESVLVDDVVDLTMSEDYQYEFKSLLEKKNTHYLVDFLSNHGDKLSYDDKASEFSEELITEVLEKAEHKSHECSLKALELFVVPYISAISKPVKQGLFSICKTISKNYPNDAIAYLLEPLISKASDLNRAHASFIVSCLKLLQNNNLSCSFLVSLLNRCENRDISNDKEKEKDIEAVVQILNFYITLPLDHHHLQKVINFFTLTVAEHPKLFSLSKLVLAFVKKFAAKLRKADESGLIDELGAVIPLMKSSLSKVCQSTFNKLVN